MTQAYASDLALFINGSWRMGEGRDALAVLNPATGAAIAELPVASAADLEEALAAAQAGFAEWRMVDVDTRGAILRKAAELIRDRADRIATLLTTEQGKPVGEARGEVVGAAAMFDFYAEEAKRAYGRVLVRPTGQRAMVIKQPVGPVAVFTPWNFPVYLLAKKLAPALAAGCSVIAKPAEECPASTAALMRCLADAGVPANVAQLVYGVPDMISRTLIGSPVIRKVSFTGSTAVGKHLMRLAADGVKRITMELGGHAPVLVFDDVDLDKTLDMLVPQKFRNAGQVCVSPTRFYVHERIYDAFLEGFAARTARLKVGNGLEPGVQMGPLANPRRPEALTGLITDATAQGGRVLAGGEAYGEGFFFQPTLLADVPDTAAIMNTEPFGPVAVTRPFATLDEAIANANRVPFGLAAFAFTDSLRTANLVGDALEAGMVGINSFAISFADAPFGGIKESGFGSEGGPEGLESYLVTKAIHQA
ncbi:NAD-dependent succinate-semialdehyde dehydrogenase [Erythrobacter sp. T5W1-R]|uniref:NAD-dependent succinate-semialdehyde dehydrogenase n=1 Tax=Erythrobacter sp. T5W1-R TaxID=3101752 RepID=UPI002AFF5868|nr:NAD-dependent succinate-semialdehyde dehydrogenase [Erythrobacter sp. T5W1-R]MEA1619121.1 NAD-dependent succinate-semialdehyde dehydrogenase [Erythrobacter sp. T5W1-R]